MLEGVDSIRSLLSATGGVRSELRLDSLHAVEVGDGNLDKVFLCSDTRGRRRWLARRPVSTRGEPAAVWRWADEVVADLLAVGG